MANPYLRIDIDPAYSLIHLTWLRSVDNDEFETGFLYAVKLVAENQYKVWINDFTAIDIPDLGLLYNKLLPQLIEAGFEKGTALVPRSSSYLLSFSTLKSQIREKYSQSHNIKMEVFTNLELAYLFLGIPEKPNYSVYSVL